MRHPRRLLILAAAAIIAVGCSGPATFEPGGVGGAGGTGSAAGGTAAGGTAAGGPVRTAIARPALLADLAAVELREPPVTGAGPVPTFGWAPVDGAATYRLTVLGPEGPRWAWEGPDTSVRYGAAADGQRGPALVPGSWWSVAAITADGELLAASELRPVSPTDDPGPDPVWASGGANAAAGDAAASAPAEAPATDTPAEAPAEAPAGPATPETVRPCSLLTKAQLVKVIGGEWSDPEESLYPHGKGGSCDWTYGDSRFGGGVSISISRVEAYDPAGWGGTADPLVAGIGEDAYLTRSGMDRKVGIRRGAVSVIVSFDYGDIDFEAYAAIARLVDSALQ